MYIYAVFLSWDSGVATFDTAYSNMTAAHKYADKVNADIIDKGLEGATAVVKKIEVRS